MEKEEARDKASDTNGSSEETFRKLSYARLIRIYKGLSARFKTIAENLKQGGKLRRKE
jgi:hypothetical protein